jgi:N-acetylmuramate 1-kinase
MADGNTVIAMDAPPAQEDVRPFIEIARRLRAIGLNVPEIVAQDPEQGFLLLTDLGDRLYLRALTESSADGLYADALKALVRLQAGGVDTMFLPAYDEAFLRRELEIFREWYLLRHLGLKLSAAQQAAFDETVALLVASALEQPRVWVHRDYHSRNLMVTPAGNPGILDFQGALYGPITYDLASLLRDSYIAWPRTRIAGWIDQYLALATDAGLPVAVEKQRFLRWFDWMGLQRHIKVVGIFARLSHRDGKPGYLDDIPRTLGYIVDVSGRYSELQRLHALLSELGVAQALPRGTA